MVAGHLDTKAHAQHLGFAWGQAVKNVFDHIAQARLHGCLHGGGVGAVFNEIAQVAVVIVTNGRFHRDRLFGDLHDLADLVLRNLHALSQYAGVGLKAKLLQVLTADTVHLVDGFDHVHRDANGAGLVGNGAGDGLANPPGGVAEKFNLPVFTFVDTPGAYPGIGAEERGQSEAIGHNLYAMAELRVPIISTIIGEGGSGGALAIAVGNVVMMLQYSTYSVISPEGCASILWRSPDKAPEAAAALAITADRLKEFGLIDRVVNEPVGGAHRDPRVMARLLRRSLADALRQLSGMTPEQLIEHRLERLLSYGRFQEVRA